MIDPELEYVKMDSKDAIKLTADLCQIQQEMINKIIDAIKAQAQQIDIIEQQVTDLVTTVEKMDANLRV